MNFEYLDETTRKLMVEEIDAAFASNSIHLSLRLREGANGDYVGTLRRAAQEANVAWLTERIRPLLVAEEVKNGRSRKVPSNAAEVLAEGEFNRFYMRALCRRAIADGRWVVVVRARASANPRPESEAMIGREFDPRLLLEDLRVNTLETVLGLPRPGSGLSITLGRKA